MNIGLFIFFEQLYLHVLTLVYSCGLKIAILHVMVPQPIQVSTLPFKIGMLI